MAIIRRPPPSKLHLYCFQNNDHSSLLVSRALSRFALPRPCGRTDNALLSALLQNIPSKEKCAVPITNVVSWSRYHKKFVELANIWIVPFPVEHTNPQQFTCAKNRRRLLSSIYIDHSAFRKIPTDTKGPPETQFYSREHYLRFWRLFKCK